MTVLLEMKERLKLVYSKSEFFLVPLVKFLLAYITFNTLNDRMGYMTRLDDLRIVLIAALACSFLPVGAIVLIAAVFSLMHMYALSMEVALVGLCMYLIMYLLFFRFSPKDSLVVVLTPLLCTMKIQYVIPIVVGLLCGPASAVSVGCGVGVYHLLETVLDNAANVRTMGDEEALAKVRLMIESILGNKAMLVIVAAFAVTVLIVYLIRRMPIRYSWTIAIFVGAMADVAILLIGDLLYDVNLSVANVLLGSLLAVVAAKIIEFFRFCVDYSRTEKVQFEDDEYYYYVKAVPKMAVSMSTRTVKRINSQRDRETAPEAGSGARQTERQASGRTVTTERTAAGRNGSHGGARRTQGSTVERRGGKSVTIGATAEANEANAQQDDYEEWL